MTPEMQTGIVIGFAACLILERVAYVLLKPIVFKLLDKWDGR